MTVFTFQQNRSERALQVELLAPVLADKDMRRGLLMSLRQPVITKSVIHY